jgi:hypothetical protein
VHCTCVGTKNYLILTTGHLSAQMSSGQVKVVMCSNNSSRSAHLNPVPSTSVAHSLAHDMVATVTVEVSVHDAIEGLVIASTVMSADQFPPGFFVASEKISITMLMPCRFLPFWMGEEYGHPESTHLPMQTANASARL